MPSSRRRLREGGGGAEVASNRAVGVSARAVVAGSQPMVASAQVVSAGAALKCAGDQPEVAMDHVKIAGNLRLVASSHGKIASNRAATEASRRTAAADNHTLGVRQSTKAGRTRIIFEGAGGEDDAKVVQAARELRDRYLERINAPGGARLACGKYAVSRVLLQAPAGDSRPVLQSPMAA